MANKESKYWIIGIVSAVVITSAIGLYFYFKDFFSKLTFKPGLNLSFSNLSGLLSTLQSARTTGVGVYLDVPMKLLVDNANKVGVNLQDFFANIKYNGETILRTKPESVVLEDVNIPANVRDFQINDTVEILINANAIKFISELLKNNKPLTEITLRGKSLGFPLRKTFTKEFSI